MFSNFLFLTGIEILAEVSDEVKGEMSLIVGGELVEDEPVRTTAVLHHGSNTANMVTGQSSLTLGLSVWGKFFGGIFFGKDK